VARLGDFTLPTVEAISALPDDALLGTLTLLTGLTLAIGTRLAQRHKSTDADAEDVVDKATAMALLKLKSERWLRSPDGKNLRCPRPVGGEWRYSRRKIAAYMRGEPLP